MCRDGVDLLKNLFAALADDAETESPPVKETKTSKSEPAASTQRTRGAAPSRGGRGGDRPAHRGEGRGGRGRGRGGSSRGGYSNEDGKSFITLTL